MVEYLKDFLVLKEGGKVIYSTNSEIIKDQLLFGGFIEALNSFYSISLNDNLYQIEGSRYRITFLSKLECQFVGISSMNVNKNKALDELELFTNRFIEMFPEILDQENDNDVRVFHRFNSEIVKTKKDYLVKQYESNYISYLLEDW